MNNSVEETKLAERRFCPAGRREIHHPDKHACRCVACEVPLVDTVHGWLARNGAAS